MAPYGVPSPDRVNPVTGYRHRDSTPRRIATGIGLVAGVRRAVLRVVDVEARAVTATHVEVSVTSEQERADRVAGVLLIAGDSGGGGY